MPRKVRYKKQQKGSLCNKINKNVNFYFKNKECYSLKSLTFCRLSEKQIESCRMTINKSLKKFGKLTTNIQADIPVTKKPIEIRMGKGKGAVDKWVCKIKSGTVLFTIESNYRIIAINALKSVKIKLPVLTKIVSND